MAAVFYKVYYTPPGGSQVDITSAINWTNKRGLDLKASSFTFTVDNGPYRDKVAGASVFVEDGSIEAYIDYSPITKSTSQLVFTGKVKEIKPSFGESGSGYQVVCMDNTSILLSNLWSFTYQNKKPYEIIQSVVSQASSIVTTNNVATTTSAGAAFPDVASLAMVFKPVYEWINEVSQPQYTGENRAYMFYVDKNSDLHWFYPSQSISASYTEGSDEIYEASFSRNANDVVNMVIYNAGQDLNGNGIVWYYFDTTTRASTIKMKFQPMTDIGRDLVKAEIDAGNLAASSTGTIPYNGKLYIVNVAYSALTTSWGQTSIADFAAYNSAFRTQVKNVLAKARAQKITSRFGKLTWSGSISIRGTHDRTAGDVIYLTSRTCGLAGQSLRVVDVKHEVSDNGWFTSLELKEDEQALST